MPTAVLVRGGGRWFLVDPDARTFRAVGADPARGSGSPWSADAQAIREALAKAGPGLSLRAGDPAVLTALTSLKIRSELATLAELRTARETVPWPAFPVERAGLLELARRRFSEQLASPEETLIALAREEERVERVRSREQGAAEHWITPETGPMAEYTSEWGRFRADLDRHHDALIARLERAAERAVPNLSAVVGPRVAARLVAAAGGIAPLGRMSASRLQLLGARRRAGGNRGPKYGVLARTVHVPEVPPAARGAFARSVAALAAIAARADATTRASLIAILTARKERRLRGLRVRYPA